ncbi:MAG: hypothetical protein EBS51_13495 [Planctomycetia bacterium]|nr:hypothetical protein [Planctomycetia bacterium]
MSAGGIRACRRRRVGCPRRVDPECERQGAGIMQRRRLLGVSRAGGPRPDRAAGTTSRIGLEALEPRQLLAVTATGSLPDISVAAGTDPAVVPTDGLFAVTGVDVQGTVVRMATQAGAGSSYRDLFIELFDTAIEGRSAAPVSTANFLDYVTSGRYDSSFFHRATDFAGDTGPARFLQGGGFFDRGPELPARERVGEIATDEPIALEWAADRPNVAGTIAYARTSDPNSATSGFFFNVTANPSFDDPGGGGRPANQYAVFGRVLGDGQAILDDYAALERFDGDGPSYGTFDTLPLAGDDATPIFDRLLSVRSATVVAAPQATVGLRVDSSDPDVVSARINADGAIELAYGTASGDAVVTVTGTDLSGDEAEVAFTVSVAAEPTDGDIIREIVLGGSGPTSLVATDADGTRSTYTWRGPGTATFSFTIADEPVVSGRRVTVSNAATLASIAFDGGSASSSLVVASAGGDGFVEVERIESVGALGRLTLSKVRVTAGVSLADGVAAVVLAGVGGVVDIGGTRVATATLGDVADAEVTLPAVGALKLSGVRDSTIALASTGTVVAGAVERATLTVTGNPRRVAFASLADATVQFPDAAGTLAVEVGSRITAVRVGRFIDSALLVGVAEGVDLPADGTEIAASSRLGAFTVTSRDPDAFAGSQVVAGAIGTAQLGLIAATPDAGSAVVARTAAVVSGRGPTRPFTIRKAEGIADVAEVLAASGVDADRLSVTAFG